MEEHKWKALWAAIFWLACLWLNAQNRYMVFFQDKTGNTYSVNEPSAFLSERAIARRAKMSVSITEEDLPVNATYVNHLTELGVNVFFTSRWMNGALVQMPEGMVEQVSALPEVTEVILVAPGAKRPCDDISPVQIPEIFKEPTAKSSSTTAQNRLIRADRMHIDGNTGEGILIAVLDDGFLGINEFKPFEHLYRENRLLGGVDYVGNCGNVYHYDDHGSSCLSILAASYEDFVGTAPGASYLLCVTEDYFSEYRIEEYNWLLAAEYADSAGADIISSSLGYSTFNSPEMNYTYADMDGQSSVIAQAATKAVSRGMIVVVSAGNEGSGSWKYITSPADVEQVLAVGNVNSQGVKAFSSSYGPTSDGRIKPDVMAMGSNTAVFLCDGISGVLSTGGGTSFAAPQIAGLAAGIWQANPDWTNQQVIDAIRYTASRALAPDTAYGYGLANYSLAVQGATLSAADILEDRVTVYPNPFNDNLINIDFGGISLRRELEISLVDTRGTVLHRQVVNPSEMPNVLQIAFEAQESGMYFLILKSKKSQKTVKLIKV